MQSPASCAKIDAMSARTALMTSLCMVFLLTSALGVHLHGSQPHENHLIEHAHGHAAHVEQTTYVVAESDADHFEAHLLHGDVDLDSDTALGKLPSLKFFAMLLAVQGSLV